MLCQLSSVKEVFFACRSQGTLLLILPKPLPKAMLDPKRFLFVPNSTFVVKLVGKRLRTCFETVSLGV